jgi:hypothetical protein
LILYTNSSNSALLLMYPAYSILENLCKNVYTQSQTEKV